METSGRVVRVFRVQVKPGRESDWDRLSVDQAQEQLVGAHGLVARYRGWNDENPGEFVSITNPLGAFINALTIVINTAEKDAPMATGISNRKCFFCSQIDPMYINKFRGK